VRVVLQRVSSASVTVGGEVVGRIGPGLLALVGVGRLDTGADAERLAGKTARLRLFDDATGVMNRSVLDTGGAVLAVSQFTLLGDCRKGNRPSWMAAAPPEVARPLFAYYVAALRATGLTVETGVFQADMRVALENDGPVTLLLDSRPGPGGDVSV
jgi:D-tyrosyl-tRNA(Tyr) deacylase